MINFRKRICTVVFNVFPGIVVVHPREVMAENLGMISKQICLFLLCYYRYCKVCLFVDFPEGSKIRNVGKRFNN